MTLRQDPNNPDPQKLGTFNTDSWAAYVLNGEVFIKRAKANPTATYPDFGCSMETFTNNEFLEIETLGPMTEGRSRTNRRKSRALESAQQRESPRNFGRRH